MLLLARGLALAYFGASVVTGVWCDDTAQIVMTYAVLMCDFKYIVYIGLDSAWYDTYR